MPRPKRSNIPLPKGRPVKEIDWNKVDAWLEAGCTGADMAREFDMHHQTFYDRVQIEKGMLFTDYCALKKARGDDLLRNAQFKKAVEHLDNTMLIWLGKQRLEQREPQALEKNTVPHNDPQITLLIEALNAYKATKYATKSETDNLLPGSQEEA